MKKNYINFLTSYARWIPPNGSLDAGVALADALIGFKILTEDPFGCVVFKVTCLPALADLVALLPPKEVGVRSAAVK